MVTVATMGEGRDCQKQSLYLNLWVSDADEVAENA